MEEVFDNILKTSPTLYVSEFLSNDVGFGTGEVWGPICPGAHVGKIIETSPKSESSAVS